MLQYRAAFLKQLVGFGTGFAHDEVGHSDTTEGKQLMSTFPARSARRSAVPLIVHSHLRWDFVWQRPQQLLTRFAEHAPVFFLEEPVFVDDIAEGTLDVTVPYPNVFRGVPRLPAAMRPEGYDAAVAQVRALALAALAAPAEKHGIPAGTFQRAVQWFYTPMPAPAMLGAFHEIGVVYDCMDELAQFRFADPDLMRRERMLMSQANVVFTGGYKLWESKSQRHPNVHYFGCGVDADHFAQARDPQTPVPADVAQLGAPIAGYYGVIDERLDYELIAQLAASDRKLQVVMIGPTAKVDPRDLPQAPNIHWLGSRSYDALPNYVKAFDVCLMPFALNDATEFINPTKTLEYMAAGKPIVSTAVADVVRNFTPVVNVATTQSGFVRAVAADAQHPDSAFIAEGISMARAASWESIVDAMNALLLSSLSGNVEVPAVRAERSSVDRDTGERMPTMAGGVVAASRASA